MMIMIMTMNKHRGRLRSAPYYESEAMMRKKNLIKLPEDVNPHSLLTFKKASEISGIPVGMLYEWRRQPRKGMQVYKFGRKVFVQAEEFIRWVNARIQSADLKGR